MKVIKRDGSIVAFDNEKIIRAVRLSAKRTRKTLSDIEEDIIVRGTINDLVTRGFSDEVKVDDIHLSVENVLWTISKELYSEYRSYNNYKKRFNHSFNNILKNAKNIVYDGDKENANKDSCLNSTKMTLTSELAGKEMYLEYELPKHLSDAHKNMDFYIHDTGHRFYNMINCCLLDVGNIYKDGYYLNGEFIKEPKTIEVALDQLIDVILIASSQQYGGLTIPEIDNLLEPYAQKSLNLLMQKYNGDREKSLNKLYEIMFRCFKRIQFKIKCVINAGGQTSFVTWTFGTNTSELGKLIVKAILDVRKQYMAVFPKLIYLYHSDISGEGKPNYDLYLQSIRCSMTQLYPDYCSAEKGYLKEVYDRCGTIISAMGCVDGNEVVTYKIGEDLYVESFERMWDRLKCYYKEQEQPAKGNYFMDVDNVKIYDSSKKEFVKVKRVIKNKDKGDWNEIKFSNGRSLLATSDHPLPIIEKGRTFVKDIKVGDKIQIVTSQYSEESIDINDEEAWLNGFILCDGCYDNQFSVSIAATGEDDIEDRYRRSMKNVFDLDTETIIWNREKRGNYKEIRARGQYKNIVDKFKNKYGGLQKKYRQIPNEVFSWNRDAKLSFLAGMIDADGYINNSRKTRSVVQLGSTNKELAIQTLALAQSLGYVSRLYINHYTSKDLSKIRYRIEFNAEKELVDKLACDKKKAKYTKGKEYQYPNISEVKSIKPIGFLDKFSYDVTTESDKFDVSGIVSHNCRAYLSPWWDENGKERYIGRANLGAVSLALPRYAIISGGNKERFFEILDKYFDYAMEVHHLTFEKMRKVKAKTNPLMFCEGGGIYKLNPEDTIEKALEYMTYSIGYIGLTEVCYYMTGKHLHEDNSFAIEVLQHLNKRIEEEKKKTGKLIALYATPSEGYCDKLLKADREKFGVIPYLTDKKWYHNSFHVGSNFDINAIDKQLAESPLFHLSNGGHIVYNEYPMVDNFEAFKQIVDFAMKEGLYYGVNVENNTCNNCGYVGDFKDRCPKCNSENTTTITRCCGYLGHKKKNGDTRYNEGKDAEVENRVKHFNCFVDEGDINE